MFLLETGRSIALFGLLSVSRRCFSGVLADRWWPFWRQAMHQLKLVPQIHSPFKWLRCSPSTLIHWCCVVVYTLHLPRLWPCFEPRRRWQTFTKPLEDVGASIIKRHQTAIIGIEGDLCCPIGGLVGLQFSSSNCCQPTVFWCANTGASWSMATTDEGGMKLKKLNTSQHFLSKYLINDCRSSALAFETSRGWQKILGSSCRFQASWVVRIEALRWKSVRHVQ